MAKKVIADKIEPIKPKLGAPTKFSQEIADNIYLTDKVNNKEITKIIEKYPNKLNEDDYVILKENSYQIFDGIKKEFVVKRNNDYFKSINTLYINLEKMLAER